MKGGSYCPFFFSLRLCPSDGVLQSCPSSWPLLTSCKTSVFLQEQIQVILETFCFNRKEYFYRKHEPVGKGTSCLQGPLGWLFFGELPHPEGMELMASVTATICRAANPGRARTHHPGRRLQLAGGWAKGPRSWAVKIAGAAWQTAAGRNVISCTQHQAIHPETLGSCDGVGTNLSVVGARLVPLCVHFRSRRKPRGGFAVVGTGSCCSHRCAHVRTAMPKSHGT